MSKRTLATLLPVAALITFAMVPPLALATTAQAPTGTALAAGAAVTWQSTNFVIDTEEESGEKGSSLACTHSELSGTVTANGGATVEGNLTKDTLTGCSMAGFTADVITNASAAAPWKYQVQQPDPFGTEVVHVHPPSGGVVQFTIQPQFIGSVTNCDYSGPGVQFTILPTPVDVLHVTGTRQVFKQSGSKLCPKFGSIQGQFTFRSGGNSVSIDMT